RDRVRDGAAPLGGPALAHADERGGGPDGGARGGEVSREGVRWERDTARGSAGGTTGGGPDHRRGSGRCQRREDGGGAGRPGDAARPVARSAALSRRCAPLECRSALL